MSSPSKKKGYTFEKEIVDKAHEAGFDAERAWGSDGRAKGWHEKVDAKIEGDKAQCKRRKRLSQVVRPHDAVDVQIVREDYGKTWVIMSLEHYFDLLSFQKELGKILKNETGLF